ncbi:hypothetical protein BD309DRAFT_523520 [Dichomitus squalens]|nr:hypothetical protein BD309DRAFT_523520 [Dichomitus squalens]
MCSFQISTFRSYTPDDCFHTGLHCITKMCGLPGTGPATQASSCATVLRPLNRPSCAMVVAPGTSHVLGTLCPVDAQIYPVA